MDQCDSLSRSAHPGGGRPDPIPMASLPRQLAELQRQMEETQRLLRDPRDDKTVAEVVAAYLEYARTEGLAADSLKNRASVLGRFAGEHGALRVCECTPLHLHNWIQKQTTWKSPFVRNRVCATVQRCFNLAANMRVIRANPFKGAYFAQGDPQPGPTNEEFRALLRHCRACLRRLLLALYWTGARPGELRALCWHHIDWEKGIAVLDQHKTRKKTGKPRVIVLTPPMVRLLRWLERHRGFPAAVCLRRILANGPVPIKAVVRAMKEHGFSYRSLYLARRRLGARYCHVEGFREDKRVLWALPRGGRPQGPLTLAAVALREILADGPVWSIEVAERMTAAGFPLKAMYRARRELGANRRMEWKKCMVLELPAGAAGAEEEVDRFVFLNCYGGRWTRHALATAVRRFREKAGLDSRCRPYGCRHLFGTQAVKSGLNLKAIAVLMGHATVATTERNYVHIDGDFDFLREAAQQVHKNGK